MDRIDTESRENWSAQNRRKKKEHEREIKNRRVSRRLHHEKILAVADIEKKEKLCREEIWRRDLEKIMQEINSGGS